MPIAALLLLLFAARAVEVPAAGPPSPDQVRQEFLARLNEARAAAGARPLVLAAPLNRVAQQNAEEVRDSGAVHYDERSIPRIQQRLRKAGYEAHGWHQELAAAPGDAGEVLAWVRSGLPETFHALLDPDYQELGVGISDLRGSPLYTFFLAWRESESFARGTAGLSDLERVRAEMLARANAERTAAGVRPLLRDPRLDAAAQRHAEDMLARAYYDHVSPDGTSPNTRTRKSGYVGRIVGENIARGPMAVQEVMDNWMGSTEHRRNLLLPAFTHLGVGVAVGHNAAMGDTVIWVQDFGSPALPQIPAGGTLPRR
ncbi:MAG TPA: CAP domain-containing protein [Thermoanaerobaculia bacterium]|nr:CAP domain-containing protein [Thermoanaerobaculia bacterium]